MTTGELQNKKNTVLNRLYNKKINNDNNTLSKVIEKSIADSVSGTIDASNILTTKVDYYSYLGESKLSLLDSITESNKHNFKFRKIKDFEIITETKDKESENDDTTTSKKETEKLQAKILNNTLEPKVGDYIVMINMGTKSIFSIMEVSKLNYYDYNSTFFQINLNLEDKNSTNDSIYLNRLESLVIENYYYRSDISGVENRRIFTKNDKDLTDELENIIIQVNNIYNDLFYDSNNSLYYIREDSYNLYYKPEVNKDVFLNNIKITKDDNDYKSFENVFPLFDAVLNRFIFENGLMQKNEYSLIDNNLINSIIIDNFYNNSIYEVLVKKDVLEFDPKSLTFVGGGTFYNNSNSIFFYRKKVVEYIKPSTSEINFYLNVNFKTHNYLKNFDEKKPVILKDIIKDNKLVMNEMIDVLISEYFYILKCKDNKEIYEEYNNIIKSFDKKYLSNLEKDKSITILEKYYYYPIINFIISEFIKKIISI